MNEYAMLPRCVTSHKVGYADETKALVALGDCVEARRTGRGRRMERAVYRCAGCGLWHLTRLADDPLEADDLQPLVVALQHRWR